jgi:biopolymer transport protein ExbB
MLELVLAGGGMMLPIIIASILALAIILERLYSLRRSRVVGGDPVGMIQSWQGHGGVTRDRLEMLQRTSPLGRILAAGLAGSHTAESMRVRIEDAGRHVAHEMERYLNTLGTIALIAPLLGLLGTVIGIIDVFQAITAGNGSGSVAPELLAGGIAKALITTAAGIIVAVPAFIFHRYFRGLVDELVIDMEAEAIRLVDLVHPAGGARRAAA